MKKINVDIKKLVELKEQGWSDAEIAKHLKKQKIEITSWTVGNQLWKYYRSQGKVKPKAIGKIKGRKTINVDINELVTLKEQGWSDAKISEYMTKQGETISLGTVNKRLTSYYDNLGTEKPNMAKQNKIDVDINKLVTLKEQGWTDAEIAEYMTEQGKTISRETVNKRLTSYYEAQGKPKPGSKKGPIKIHVDIEKLAELKEEGMTYEKIAKYLNEQGIEISSATVRNRLIEYYKSQGIAKPKKRRDVNKIDIDIEELVKLTELGMLDYEIVNYLAEQGKKVSVSAVSKKLKEYYKAQGRTNKRGGAHKKNINIEKLVALKKQGMSNKRIACCLKEQGIEVSAATVQSRLIEYYTQGIDRIIKPYNNDIEEVLIGGMTIEEFIFQYKQQEKEDEIKEKFKKLRVVAEYSKKENEKIIPDHNFIAVLDLLDGSEEKINKYKQSIENYIHNETLKKGKIDEIKDTVFSKNVELMIYTLARLKVKLLNGYDQRIFERLKQQYKNKIDKYLTRIELIDENRMQIEKTNSAPNSSGDGR